MIEIIGCVLMGIASTAMFLATTRMGAVPVQPKQKS